jgi:hypothetical protein
MVTIKEGAMLHLDCWQISPETDLDVFVTNKFSGKEVVTFMTDIDSISIEVEPNQLYEFDVLLNGEIARTQINTHTDRTPSRAQTNLVSYRRNDPASDDAKHGRPEKIPFTLGTDSRIYIRGKVNGSMPIKLLFDTGASSNVITTSVVGTKVQMLFNRDVQNEGSDGVTSVRLSDSNRLELGGLVWDDLSFISIDYPAVELEGLVGWIAFDNTVVEINYDEMALIIHDSMDSVDLDEDRYSEFEMKILRGLPYIEGTVVTRKGNATGWFEFDTGSDWTLSLSQKFASKKALNGSMPQIGALSSSGSAGVWHKEIMVRAPELRLGDAELYQIPMSIREEDPKGVNHNDIMGNLMLKRFNAVLDFKNLKIYLAPNTQMHLPYSDK